MTYQKKTRDLILIIIKVSIIYSNGKIKELNKNKKSFIANKIAEVILDKLLLDDRNIH